jgi:hypothetical protein
MQANVEDYLDTLAQGAALETGKQFSSFFHPMKLAARLTAVTDPYVPEVVLVTALWIPYSLNHLHVNHLERNLANRCASGSVYGWCGSSSGHCDGGCQTTYGTCNAQVNALTARDA